MSPEQNIINEMNDLEHAINNHNCSAYDYTGVLQGINNELRDIGHGNMGYGCLAEIRSELQKLNKGQIVAAMIVATKQNSLESLKKFSDLTDKYLEYEAINS